MTDNTCHECETAPATTTIYLGRASQALDELRTVPVCQRCHDILVPQFAAFEHLRVAKDVAGGRAEVHLTQDGDA